MQIVLNASHAVADIVLPPNPGGPLRHWKDRRKEK